MNLVFVDCKTLGDDDPWRVAVHESGHAIYAVNKKLSIHYVEIGADQYGEVEVLNGPLSGSAKTYTEIDIQNWKEFYAAGAAAKQVVFGEIRRHGIRGDVATCDALCHKFAGNRDVFNSCIESAIKQLDADTVRLVAKQLVAVRCLLFDEVRTIMETRLP